MSNLTRCLSLHAQGLSEFEISELRKAVKIYKDEGYPVKEANASAIKDILEDLDKEHADIMKQVYAYRGVEPPKPVKVFRGAERGSTGEWYTPDKDAAREYKNLYELGEIQKTQIEGGKFAKQDDILKVAKELGIDPSREALYSLVSDQYPEILDELKKQGFNGVHLPMGEDFTPAGREIESYRIFKEEKTPEPPKPKPVKEEVKPKEEVEETLDSVLAKMRTEEVFQKDISPEIVQQLEKMMEGDYSFIRYGNPKTGDASYKFVSEKNIAESKADQVKEVSIKKEIPKTDSLLESEGEITQRIESIDRQISKLDSILNPEDFDAHHEKYSKLVARKGNLGSRLRALTPKPKEVAPEKKEVEPEAKPEAKVKEPWMMTSEEFDNLVKTPGKNFKPTGATKIPDKYTSSLFNDLYWEKLSKKQQKEIELLGAIKDQIKGKITAYDIHKGYIQQALSEGKPVPDEVLKDYPELTKAKPPVKKEAVKKEEVEDVRLGMEGYIEAKKNPGGFYQLFFRGTRNEIFPGEKFKSASEARQYWKAQKVKQEEAVKEAPAPVAEVDRTGDELRQKIHTHFEVNVVPVLKDFFTAFDALGKERLIKNKVMTKDSASEWLLSVINQRSSWAKGGRKTGITGIQMLSQKGLWPTNDDSGENLRKTMLKAVKAVKNAPGYSYQWIQNVEDGKLPFEEAETPKPTYGKVWLKVGGVKPFLSWREIKKGKDKDKIEVTLPNGKKIKVDRGQIRAWPEAEKVDVDKPVLLTGESATFKIKAPATPIYTVQAVERMVSYVRARLPNIGTVKVVAAETDISKSFYERSGLKWEDLESNIIFGAYDPKYDLVYIVANNVGSQRAFTSTILHEAIGHRGVSALLSDQEQNTLYRQIKEAYVDTDIGKHIINAYGLDLKARQDQLTFSRELIAHMAQTGDKPSLLDKVIAWVKRAIRKVMPSLKIGDTEIMTLLGRSYEYAKMPAQVKKGFVSRPVYSMDRQDDYKEQADAWIKNYIANNKDPKIVKELAEYNKSEADSQISTLKGIKDFVLNKNKPLGTFVAKKPDVKWWESVLETPLHYYKRIGALKRMFVAANKKVDNLEEMLYRMTLSPDGENYDTKVVGLVKKLDPKGAEMVQRHLTGNDKDQYGYRVLRSVDEKTGIESFIVIKPGEKKQPQSWDSRSKAVTAMSATAEKANMDPRLVQYTIDDTTGKWSAWIPKDAKPIASFPTEDEAWGYAREEEGKTFQKKYNASESAVHALLAFRRIADRGAKIQMQEYQDTIDYHIKNDIPLPVEIIKIGGENISVDLRTAMTIVGNRRGYYFPRNRGQGKWELRAEQKGKSPYVNYYDIYAAPGETGDATQWKKGINWASPIGKQIRKLKSEGFTDANIIVTQAGRIPEDVFVENINRVINVQTEINEALKKIKTGKVDLSKMGFETSHRTVKGDKWFVVEGTTNKKQRVLLPGLGGQRFALTEGEPKTWNFKDPTKATEGRVAKGLFSVSSLVDQDLVAAFGKELTESLSDIEKGRGARAHMIARSARRGKDVFRGYEEDPEIAISSYAAGIAGSEAKKVMARELIRDFFGLDISFDHFGLIKGYKGSFEDYTIDFQTAPVFEGDFTEYRAINPGTGIENQEAFEKFASLDDNEIEREDFDAINDSAAMEENTAEIEALQKRKGELTEEEKERLSEATAWLNNQYYELTKERRIDSSEQTRAWRDGKTYIANMLRNDEYVDRIVNTVKGIAVVKYLAGRVSAPVVNLTAMATSVPAAMNIYAGIPIHTTFKHLAGAGADYIKFKAGKTKNLSDEAHWALNQITQRKWDAAKFNKEALSALESKVGRKWDKLIDWGMIGFGASEQLNRGATILGSYNAIRQNKPDLTKEEALKLAKEVSDNAHSVYNKANWPSWVRGTGFAPNVAKAFYLFKSFSHNYLQLMKDAYGPGVVRLPENSKAFAFLAISPAIVAGTGAMVGKELLMKLLEAFGVGGDDPEEEFYSFIADNMGAYPESLARYGMVGAMGINLKGSLTIGTTDLLSDLTLTGILGAPGSMIKDVGTTALAIRRGAWLKAFEKAPFMPLALANPLKGFREYTEGVTSWTNAPVFYGNEQIMADKGDLILRFFSFNPVDIAEKREIQYSESKVERKYTTMRTDIYSRFKAYFGKDVDERTAKDLMNLLEDVREYNKKMENSNLFKKVFITSDSISKNIKRAFTPSKKERLRPQRGSK